LRSDSSSSAKRICAMPARLPVPYKSLYRGKL
jgi:hypothetical protein